jgi:hypothetical protein
VRPPNRQLPTDKSADTATLTTRPADDQGTDDHAEADADAVDEDADDDQDPLDLLTSRDEDGENDPQKQRPIEERYKALSKRARKLERSLKKSLPVQQALREAGVDLRTLMQRHQTLANIEAAIDANPRLKAAIYGTDDTEDEPETRSTNTRRDSRAADGDDETVEYPFDTQDGPGRFVADLDKRVRTSQRDLVDRLERIEKAINTRVGRIEQSTQEQQRTTVVREWKGVTDAAPRKSRTRAFGRCSAMR